MPSPIAPEIFKAYDIRGIVDHTLTEEAVEAIGRGLGTMGAAKGVKRFVVGRDGRLSGPRSWPHWRAASTRAAWT